MATEPRVARPQAAVAHKVLNNNVVISIDQLGQERVLMGRGLGFQLQPTDTVDPAKVEKTFILEQGSGADPGCRATPSDSFTPGSPPRSAASSPRCSWSSSSLR